MGRKQPRVEGTGHRCHKVLAVRWERLEQGVEVVPYLVVEEDLEVERLACRFVDLRFHGVHHSLDAVEGVRTH